MNNNNNIISRLLEVAGFKIVNEVKTDTPLEQLMLQGNKLLRVEEVPMEETCMGDYEMLIPVAHFHQVCFCFLFGNFSIKSKSMLQSSWIEISDIRAI